MGKVQSKAKAVLGPLTGVFRLWAWILLAWSLYRYFFKLPETIDEFIAKPLIFVVPVLWYVIKVEKKSLASLGLTTKNLFPSIYMGVGIGFLFAIQGLIANFIKNGAFDINPIASFQQYGFLLILISLATAFSEEILGRGFLFSRFMEKTNGNLPYAAIYSSIMFALLHVPILLTSLKYQGITLVIFFATTITISLANAILFKYSKSLVAPILVHLFWNMTVALYL